MAVDMVGDKLNGSYERVTTITTPYGPATIIGVEDLVLKRLASAKFWRVPTDFEQAFLLAKAQGDRIDWGYMEEEAKNADTVNLLHKLMSSLHSKRI